MARFDLFELPGGEGYVVDVQSDHVSQQLRTRVVVPLIPISELGKPISKLNPVIRIGGRDYAFVAQSIATLSTGELGGRAGSLAAEHGDAFSYALDILFIGF